MTVTAEDPHLLKRSELVSDIPSAHLCVAAMLNLNAGNGGHLQLPNIVLKEVTAGILGCHPYMSVEVTCIEVILLAVLP